MRRFALPFAAIVALLGLWEVLARTGALADVLGVNEAARDLLVPAPSQVAEALAPLVAPVPVTVWSPLVAEGTAKVVVALPVAETATDFTGVAPPSQYRLTVSLAPYPLRVAVTVLPTAPDVGERPRLVLTVKAAEAVAALVAPVPETVWFPFVASGTAKVAVALPLAEAVGLATGVAPPSHLTLIVSPAP